MSKFSTIVFLLATAFAYAQEKLNPAIFEKTINANDLKKHLTVIAGPEMEGRETATPGQRKAADYIEQQFRLIGLMPGNNGSYRLNYDVYQDPTVDARLEINNIKYSADKDFTINLFQNISATYSFSEISFVGQGRFDTENNDYKNLDVAGKAVLVLSDVSNQSRSGWGKLSRQVEAARKNGVAAILFFSPSSEADKMPQTAKLRKGSMYINSFNKFINPQQYFISADVAKSIMGDDYNASINSITLIGKVYFRNILMSLDKQSTTLQSSNIIGLVEGSDKKDEYVFLTAHYDHLGKKDTLIYYGADDDGSGTVSVLEMAEAFAKAKAVGKGPRRTVVFMMVSGEEKGLLGSEFYSDHPIFSLDKTSADLNIDMVGRIGSEYLKDKDSTNYLYLIGDDKLSSDLAPLADNINTKYKIKLDRKYNDLEDPNRFYFRSDHYNFARKGVPVLFYFNGVHKDYHRPTDTIDKINFSLMEKRVRYIFLTAWDIANRDNMLKRDIPLPELER